MYSFWYTYSTGQGKGKRKDYPIEILIHSGNIEDLTYRPDEVRVKCQTGCSRYGRGTSCPPNAPFLEKIPWAKGQVILIAAKLSTEWKSDKVRQSKSVYIHYTWMDAILSKLLSNLGYQLIDEYGGHFLGTGYCKGCYKCSKPCSNPKRMIFSMESTGVDVEDTVKRLFDTELQWFEKKDPNKVEYMMKVMGFFPKKEFQFCKELLFISLNKLKSTQFKIGTNEFSKMLSSLANYSDKERG
ncbi:MAG: hypothetical protein HPY50_20215 [Firmicutes bacterium]|nr:hypothetical protein [Bacillota bacterium]